MIYFNGKAAVRTATTDVITGEVILSEPVDYGCQVVDDINLKSIGPGREDYPDSGSMVIMDANTNIKIGDLLQVKNVRGVPVERKEQVVSAVNVVGGFTASHLEVFL